MRCIRLIVPVLLLAAAHAIGAVEVRCVDTVEKLDSAVRVATDEDVEIHLVQGTYDIDNTVLTDFGLTDPEPDDDITIIGGYSTGCATRLLEPFSTILTSASGNRWIDIEGHDDSGNVTFESVEFKDLPSLIILGGPFSGGYTVRYSRVAFVRSPLLTITAHTQISQSLFVAAPNLPQMRDCALYVADPDSVSIVHSVFTGNNTKGFCIDDNTPSSGWHVDVYNNIFWGNAGTDIYLRSGDAQTDAALANNIIQTTSIVPAPIGAASASLNQNPQFIDAAAGNYRLQIGSPAINSGSTVSFGISQDLDGGPRQIGSAPDRGAYETNLDDTQTITVTNTADQLSPLIAGSLRWAIKRANDDAGLNYIHFDIPGSCPHIINLVGPLPDITDRVIIDGYTQPGSKPNASAYGFNATICIGIRGDLSDDFGLRVPSSVGPAHYLQLSGVAIGGFDVAAIDLQGGGDSWIHGVQFAGQLGTTAIGNSAVNVRIAGASYYNLIGGDDVADRNVIPFAYTAGVQLLATGADGHQNYVTNNLIGTTAGGASAAPNQTGIYVTSRNNQIRDNVISGNTQYGIELSGISAHDNFIAGNRIGLTVPSLVACFPPPCDNNEDLANGSTGILGHNDSSDNLINNNRIAYNGGSGIRLLDGQHNSLLTNITYANGGLGIDLGAGGPEPVDNDAASGQASQPNRGINYPALTLAQGGMQHGSVRSLLASTNGSYIVQLYSDSTCDAQGHGEGRVYHGGTGVTIANATAGNNGSALFEIPVASSTTLVGRVFSLTARDSLGNTSEYSQCAPYQCDQIFANAFDNAVALTCPAP